MKTKVKLNAHDAFVAFMKSHHAYTPWLTAATRRLERNGMDDSVAKFLSRNQPAMWIRRAFMWVYAPLYSQIQGQVNYSSRWEALSDQWEALCKKNNYEEF